MKTLIQCLLAAALALAASASFARADDPPKDDAAPKSECVGVTSDFKSEGKRIVYVVEMENKCEKKLRCQVYVSIMNAKGSAQGHGTLVLAGKDKGAAAKKSYSLRAKEAGGIIQVSPECKFVPE